MDRHQFDFCVLFLVILLSISTSLGVQLLLTCDYEYVGSRNYACFMKDFNTTEEIDEINLRHIEGKDEFDIVVVQFEVNNSVCMPRFRNRMMVREAIPKVRYFYIEAANENVEFARSLQRKNFEYYFHVHIIVMARLNMEILPEDMLWDLEHLLHFDVSFNKIKDLPWRLMKECPLLDTFNAKFNLIEKIPFGFFLYNPFLSYLNLAENRIKKIWVNFEPYSSLSIIDLRNNTCYDQSNGPKDLKNIEKVVHHVKLFC